MFNAVKELSDMLSEEGFSALTSYSIPLLFTGLFVAIIVVSAILIYVLLKKFIHHIFNVMRKKQGKRIHLEFLERTSVFILGVFLIITLLGWNNIGGSLLGSAAVITAVVGFAAQDVIKDVMSGLLISIYKPFDLGDRIELEDGTVGVVESITMRHVVIVRLDTLRMVIPNSKINSVSILNYSFGDIERSCIFRFPVGYESDIEKTKKVINEAIKSSPHSIPDRKKKDGSKDYGPIYFIDIADSALIMAVTVYYKAETPSESLKDDINTRVFEALVKNGIDVPYNHTAVLFKKDQEPKELQEVI